MAMLAPWLDLCLPFASSQQVQLGGRSRPRAETTSLSSILVPVPPRENHSLLFPSLSCLPRAGMLLLSAPCKGHGSDVPLMEERQNWGMEQFGFVKQNSMGAGNSPENHSCP